MGDREALLLQMSADINSLKKSWEKQIGVIDAGARRAERRAAQMMTNIERTIGAGSDRIRAALAAIGVGLSIREVQQYADAWTEARNKLAAAGVATQDLAKRQGELADLANGTRTAFASTVDLYAKLMRATEDLGASQAQIARATEIVNKSFKAGGAAASEQAAGVQQLSQALGSGVLQGDELRSLRENAPLLAKAIADEFDTTIAGLKKLGAEGKLTSDRVFKAILGAGAAIDAQFAKTIPTIADSFTRLQTEFGRYINGANAATGASAQLAGFITDVANNFDKLADAAVVTASVLGGALAGQAMVRVVAGLAGIAGGATGAAGAMVALRAAMAFLGGPVGVAITAIGAALGYLALESGRAKVELQALEQRINGQADASDRAALAADKQRQATGNLSASELAAAKNTAALTGEVKLLESAHYRAAAAAKAHAIEEAKARVEAAKTDANEARRFAARAERQVTQQVRGPIEPGSRGAAGGAALVGADPQGIIDRTAAATKEAQLLAKAEANVKKAEAELAAIKRRSLTDPGFKEPELKAVAGSPARTRTPAAPRDKSDERLAQIDAALAEADRTLTDAMLRLATDVDERATLEKRIIAEEAKIADARIRKLQADLADDKGLDPSEKDRLSAELEIVRLQQKQAADLQAQLVDREAANEKARQAFDLADADRDARADQLDLQRDLAETATDRRRIELQLLDLAEQRARAELALVEAIHGSASIEAQIARKRLDSLVERRPGEEASIARRNQTPLERFATDNSPVRAAEQFQGIAANAFDSLSSGLAEAIVSADSLGDVARNVFRQMAADLLAATVRRSFAAFLPKVFGVPGFATGTNFAPGGLAVVGEKGPELVHLPRGAQVDPNLKALEQMKVDPGRTQLDYRVIVNLEGANGDATIRKIAYEAAAQGGAAAYQAAMRDVPVSLRRNHRRTLV